MTIFNDDLPLKFPTGVYLMRRRKLHACVHYDVCAMLRNKEYVVGKLIVADGEADFIRDDTARNGVGLYAWRALIGTVIKRNFPFDVNGFRVTLPYRGLPTDL